MIHYASEAGRPERNSDAHVAVPLADIFVPEATPPYHAFNTASIWRAMREEGGKPILKVIPRNGRYELVGRRDELEALRLVGAQTTLVEFVEEPRRNWRGAHMRKRG